MEAPDLGTPQVARMVSYVARKVPRELRADAEQEAWVGLLQSLTRYDGSTELQTFGHRRCQGAVIDFQRREDPLSRRERQAVKRGEASPVFLTSLESLRLHPAAEEHPWIKCFAEDMVEILPAVLQRVIRAIYWEGRTLPELGKEFGLRPPQVWYLEVQALKLMRHAAGAAYRKAA